MYIRHLEDHLLMVGDRLAHEASREAPHCNPKSRSDRSAGRLEPAGEGDGEEADKAPLCGGSVAY